MRSLARPRRIKAMYAWEERIRAHLSPSDWLIAGTFTVLMAAGAGIALASVSMALSVEVPLSGGSHTEGVIGNPRFINPLLAISKTDRDLTELTFAGLLKGNPDGTFSPALAERYEVSEDGTAYTFHLSPDAVFHDGRAVTAADILFTIQAAKNPEIKSPRRANWEGVEVTSPDERTVTFTLKAPYAIFLENATMGILPKHLWESIAAEGFPFSELNTRPVGAGPYRVREVVRDASGVPTEYRLAAFDRAPKVPFIKDFVFRFYPDTETLGAALAGGEVDAAHSLIPEDLPRKAVHEAAYARIFGVFFNQSEEPLFADAAVRKALDAALDKKQAVDTILGGYGTPLSGPLPPDRVADQNTEAVDHLEVARAILTEAGWAQGEDGVFAKTKKSEVTRLQFTLVTGNAPELKRAAETVVEMWRAMGADVTVQFFDQNDLTVEVIRPRKYDALLFGLVVGRERDLFPFWHSSQRNDPGLNIGLYANITTDKLLEDARSELDPLKRRETTEEAAAEIAREVAAVFLYAPHFTYLTENGLKGMALTNVTLPSDRLLDVEDWYLETELIWPFFTR